MKPWSRTCVGHMQPTNSGSGFGISSNYSVIVLNYLKESGKVKRIVRFATDLLGFWHIS